jgi:hypothetical protein
MTATGTWAVPALVSLCDRLATIAPDQYRIAMWHRRAWLHRNGRHGEVYDGTDALKWAQTMRSPGAA